MDAPSISQKLLPNVPSLLLNIKNHRCHTPRMLEENPTLFPHAKPTQRPFCKIKLRDQNHALLPEQRKKVNPPPKLKLLPRQWLTQCTSPYLELLSSKSAVSSEIRAICTFANYTIGSTDHIACIKRALSTLASGAWLLCKLSDSCDQLAAIQSVSVCCTFCLCIATTKLLKQEIIS